MPIFEAGDLPPGTVVVVPFPYSDRLAEKRRPAVVVSGPTVAAAGFVWIAMITSARNAAAAGDLPIHDLATAGLAVASVVRPLKIASIEPSRILRATGVLRSDAAAEVYARLHSMIGTDPTDPRPSRASEPSP
jgi:mRNA interferase MazF